TDKRRGTPTCQRSPSPCCGLRAPSVAGPTSESGAVATVTSAGRHGPGPCAGSSQSGTGGRTRSAATAQHGDACPGVLDGSSRGAPAVDRPESGPPITAPNHGGAGHPASRYGLRTETCSADGVTVNDDRRAGLTEW